MPKSTKEIAKLGGSFDLTTPGGGIDIDSKLMEVIDESDSEGYEEAGNLLPIASIRQKDKKDEKSGKTLFVAGGFCIYDPVTESNGDAVPDVNGDTGLTLTILADQSSRVLWPTPFGSSDKPLCRAIDGQTGVGVPGGKCLLCPQSQWANGERPACTQQRNLLVYDHNNASCYVLRLGRSGLRPYNLFKGLLKRQSTDGRSIPLHALTIKLTTRYEAEPAPHFVPRFEIVNSLALEMFKEMKTRRGELNHNFNSTVQVDTVDDEHPQDDGDPMPTGDRGGELPPGVEPVKADARIPGVEQRARENKDDEGLPFE